MWDVIRTLVAEGTTVLLTTQYLDEADQLADRVAVVDRGRVIAEGRPDDLKAHVGGERLKLTVALPSDVRAAQGVLARHSSGPVQVESASRTVSAPIALGPRCVPDVVAELGRADVMLEDLSILRPSLDDVFLSLTGHGATDDLGYQAVQNVVSIHDLHATMLHLLGIDHLRLTYRFQGRDIRLTDVQGQVVHDILA